MAERYLPPAMPRVPHWPDRWVRPSPPPAQPAPLHPDQLPEVGASPMIPATPSPIVPVVPIDARALWRVR